MAVRHPQEIEISPLRVPGARTVLCFDLCQQGNFRPWSIRFSGNVLDLAWVVQCIDKLLANSFVDRYYISVTEEATHPHLRKSNVSIASFTDRSRLNKDPVERSIMD